MARIEMNDSITTFIEDLDRASQQLPDLRKQMLQAEADVVKPALKSAISSAGLVKTGTLRDSIGQSSRKSGTILLIGPSGVHHNYVRKTGTGEVRSGHLGYIFEFGVPGRGIQGKLWMQRTISRVSGDALNAAEKVHDDYLKQHNL